MLDMGTIEILKHMTDRILLGMLKYNLVFLKATFKHNNNKV